jgi:hypothetical protein
MHWTGPGQWGDCVVNDEARRVLQLPPLHGTGQAGVRHMAPCTAMRAAALHADFV